MVIQEIRADRKMQPPERKADTLVRPTVMRTGVSALQAAAIAAIIVPPKELTVPPHA
jgi:hypothetical protein